MEVQRGYRMTKPINCPSSIYNLMRKCWEHNPNDRPSFKEILIILNKIIIEVESETIYSDLSEVHYVEF
jgi:hypothetical protein